MVDYNNPKAKDYNINILKKLLPMAVLLALAVILLGAYTRLTDAGLGCPDWPGCYGKLVVPKNIGVDNYGATWEFNSRKAWTEMAHRYLAGSLGLIILAISSVLIYSNQKAKKHLCSNILPILLLFTLFFQAALGMWTVTLKLLPTVVMGHLIGGLTTLSLLTVLMLNNFKFTNDIEFSKNTKIICGAALSMVFIQIILGGWTSSNYSALPCLDFPACNGQLLPAENTLQAMNPFVAIGPNYEGGVLNNAMRVTIQLFHRWGALLTTLLILLTIFDLRKYNLEYYNNFTKVLITLIMTQVTLGIINVKWALPLVVAVMHNGIAALLLMSLIVLNYKIRVRKVI